MTIMNGALYACADEIAEGVVIFENDAKVVMEHLMRRESC